MKIISLIPYIISVLTVANACIEHHFQINLYIYVGGFSIFLLGIRALMLPHLRIGLISSVSMLIYYIAWFLALLVFQIIAHAYFESFELAVKSTLTLIWMPMVVVLYLVNVPTFNWRRFTIFQIWLGVCVAILGFVQRFFSTNIFGIIPDIKWQEFFDENMGSHRISSVLGSSQVYGLYCILLAIVALRRELEWKPWFHWLVFIGFLSASLLSGNKSVVALIILFFLLKSHTATRLPLFLSYFLLISVIVAFSLGIFANCLNNIDSSSAYMRPIIQILDPHLAEHERKGRLSIYGSIFEETNPALGNGLGNTASEHGIRNVTPESYVLQIYSEAGIIPVFLLLSSLFTGIKRALKQRNPDAYCLLICIAFSWCIVHAFASPAFFAFWAFLIGYYIHPRSLIEGYS